MMKLLFIVLGVLAVVLIAYWLIQKKMMQGVKTPDYTVVSQQKNIEVREYPPMLIAEVRVSGTRQEAANQGFRLLADFIFGNNQVPDAKSEKIAMTAPVMQKSGNEKIAMTAPVMQKSGNEKIAMTAPVMQKSGNEKIAMTAPVMEVQAGNQMWVIQFVMPKQYTLKTLPKPNNPAVKIIEKLGKKMIAIRFSGFVTESNLTEHLKVLQQYINQKAIKTSGEPVYAFYNPPWTLPMQRRNEILINLAE